jgi:hypothetical protein
MSSLVWAADVRCGVEATVASATARTDRIRLTRDIAVVRHPLIWLHQIVNSKTPEMSNIKLR